MVKLALFSIQQNNLKKFCKAFLTGEQEQSIRDKVKFQKMDPEIAMGQELDKIVGKLSPKQKAILKEFLADTNHFLAKPKQQQATHQWLQAKNIQTVSLKENKLEENMSHHDFCQQMAEALVQNNLLNQSDKRYQGITIRHNPFWGHSMSMLVDQNKIDFFDPNVGEFHFEDKKDFVKWWPTFLHLADYSSGKEKLPFNLYQATLCTPRQ